MTAGCGFGLGASAPRIDRMIQRLMPLLLALVVACATPAETSEPEVQLTTARYYVIADT